MADPNRIFNGDQIYYQHVNDQPNEYQQHVDGEPVFPADLLEPAPNVPHQGGGGGGGYVYADEYVQNFEMPYVIDQTNQMDEQWNQQYYYGNDIPYTGTEEVVVGGDEFQSYEPTLAQHNSSMNNPFEEEDDESYYPQQDLASYPVIHHQGPTPLLLEEDDFDMEDEQTVDVQAGQQPQQVVVVRQQRDVEAEIKKRRAAKRAQRVANERASYVSDDATINQKAREQAAQRFATKEGWECMNKWLKQAIEKDDKERLIQHLETLKFTDVSVDLLQHTDTAKMVREQWKKNSNKKVNELANYLFTTWKAKVAAEHKKKSSKKEKEKPKKQEKEKASPPKKISKEEHEPVKQQSTDVDLVGKLIDATADKPKEQPGASEPVKKTRVKAKVKINKGRMTGLWITVMSDGLSMDYCNITFGKLGNSSSKGIL